MSARIVNLRTARKNRDRAAKKSRGDENAARSATSRAEKELQSARADKARRDLDGHKTDE